MQQIYIDEKVTIWKRTTIDIPDDVNPKDLIKEIQEAGDAFIFCDNHDPDYNNDRYPIECPYVEYLYETEETFIPNSFSDEHTTEVYRVSPQKDELLGSW